MSRTIRRKGFNKRTSANRFAQYNNPFYHFTGDLNYWMQLRSGTVEERWTENQKWLDEVASEVHREASYVEERWNRYAMPVPRIFSRMEIIRSLRTDSDYDWDEKGARKVEKGLCIMMWD